MTDVDPWKGYPPHMADLAKLVRFLDKADDRSAAVVGAAYCERWVRDLLEARLPGLDAKLGQDLFATGRPLGTASARFDLGRAMGVLKSQTYEGLKRMATIRNRFAHFIEIDSFDHPKVAQLVDNFELKLADGVTVKSRRERFVFATVPLACAIHNEVHEPSGQPV